MRRLHNVRSHDARRPPNKQDEQHVVEAACAAHPEGCGGCQEIDLPDAPGKAVWCTKAVAVRRRLRVGKKEYLIQQTLPFGLLVIPTPPGKCHKRDRKPRRTFGPLLLLLVLLSCAGGRSCHTQARKDIHC